MSPEQTLPDSFIVPEASEDSPEFLVSPHETSEELATIIDSARAFLEALAEGNLNAQAGALIAIDEQIPSYVEVIKASNNLLDASRQLVIDSYMLCGVIQRVTAGDSDFTSDFESTEPFGDQPESKEEILDNNLRVIMARMASAAGLKDGDEAEDYYGLEEVVVEGNPDALSALLVSVLSTCYMLEELKTKLIEVANLRENWYAARSRSKSHSAV